MSLTGLSSDGTWTNDQYVGNAVDPTGLTFTATYDNGDTASVSPQAHTPTTWGETGTQTCTFSYTEGGITETCEVEATVLADDLDHLSLEVDGLNIPVPDSNLYEGSALNATDLERFTVKAVYDSGREVDVTSEATVVADDTGTDHFGPCLRWSQGNNAWKVNVRGAYRFEYDDAHVNSNGRLVEAIKGPNSALNPYQLEVAPNAHLECGFPFKEDYTESNMNPPVDSTGEHGYLIDGASAGNLAMMWFTKTQFDNDTAVDAMTFGGLIETLGVKMEEDQYGPYWGDYYEPAGNRQLGVMAYSLLGTVGDLPDVSDLPIETVTVVGELANNIDPSVGVKKSDFVWSGESTATTYFVNLVSPEFSGITVTGTPRTQRANTLMDTTGLGISANYGALSEDVTSDGWFEPDVQASQPDEWGNCIIYNTDHWEYPLTQHHLVACYNYGEGSDDQEYHANTSSFYLEGEMAPGTSRELVGAEYVTLDVPHLGNMVEPWDGSTGGFLIEGTTAGHNAYMLFTKSQYDNDTAVDMTTYASGAPLLGVEMDDTQYQPAFGWMITNGVLRTMIMSVDGSGTPETEAVLVIGELANNIDPAVGIKKTDFVNGYSYYNFSIGQDGP